jgi:hypothetical protein
MKNKLFFLFLISSLLIIFSCNKTNQPTSNKAELLTSNMVINRIECVWMDTAFNAIKNISNLDISINRQIITGVNADEFLTDTNINNYPKWIHSNNEYITFIAFHPNTKGEKTAILNIFTSVGDFTINVKGNCIQ